MVGGTRRLGGGLGGWPSGAFPRAPGSAFGVGLGEAIDQTAFEVGQGFADRRGRPGVRPGLLPFLQGDGRKDNNGANAPVFRRFGVLLLFSLILNLSI